MIDLLDRLLRRLGPGRHRSWVGLSTMQRAMSSPSYRAAAASMPRRRVRDVDVTPSAGRIPRPVNLGRIYLAHAT